MCKTNNSLFKAINIFGFCILIGINSWAKDANKIDSLLFVLSRTNQDTLRVNIMNELSSELNYSNSDSAFYFVNRAMQLAESINYSKGIADSYLMKGILEVEKSQYEDAKNDILKSLNLYNMLIVKNRRKNDFYILKQKSSAYNNIGRIYFRQGDYFKSLNNYFLSLKIREKLNDKKGVANSLNNIGLIYYRQKNYLEALRNFFESLKIRKEINLNDGIANSYKNIGMVYSDLLNYKEAAINYNNSLKLYEKYGDLEGIAECKLALSELISLQGNYSEALKINFEALNIYKKLGFIRGIEVTFSNIGQNYAKIKKTNEACKYLDSALIIAKEINNLESIMEIYSSFAELDSSKGDFKRALVDYKLFITYRDSLLNIENTKNLIKSQIKYDYDKKEIIAQTEQKKKDIIAEAEKRRQRLITISMLGGLLLATTFLIIILRTLKQVRNQRKIIAEKNKDITDSITYAKRIQQAKLPELKTIKKSLPNSFVLFKPKDIVSGDFYFFFKNEEKIFIAACDCTGHGVPGVIMSMIGSEKLFEAVSYSNKTSEILMRINEGMKASLRQSDTNLSTHDGMDIAICSLDINLKKLNYSGANRPLWLIRNGGTKIEEIKATKNAIGGFTDSNQEYNLHEIELQEGDTFYIFSDGFADTFNGISEKKLTSKRFKELLLHIQFKTMKEQEQYLENFIEEWKAGTEQVDDILVIGVRV